MIFKYGKYNKKKITQSSLLQIVHAQNLLEMDDIPVMCTRVRDKPSTVV